MTAQLLTDEQRYKEGNPKPAGTGYYVGKGKRRYIPYVYVPQYDLLIPEDRIYYRNDLFDRIERAHKTLVREELVAELRWLLDTEFPAAPPETEVVG